MVLKIGLEEGFSLNWISKSGRKGVISGGWGRFGGRKWFGNDWGRDELEETTCY